MSDSASYFQRLARLCTVAEQNRLDIIKGWIIYIKKCKLSPSRRQFIRKPTSLETLMTFLSFVILFPFVCGWLLAGRLFSQSTNSNINPCFDGLTELQERLDLTRRLHYRLVVLMWQIWQMTCHGSSKQWGLEMQVGLKLFNLLIII